MDITQEMLTMFSNNPDLLKKIITGDESLVFGYEIETKNHSFQRKHPEEQRLKKEKRQVRSFVINMEPPNNVIEL